MRRTAAPFAYAIPSNSSLISAGVFAFVRIARVDASASRRSASWFALTSSSSECQPGFHALSGLVSIQFAKPSFSQMSSHHCIVTRSPNHWCAISCARTWAMNFRVCSVDETGSASRSVSR